MPDVCWRERQCNALPTCADTLYCLLRVCVFIANVTRGKLSWTIEVTAFRIRQLNLLSNRAYDDVAEFCTYRTCIANIISILGKFIPSRMSSGTWLNEFQSIAAILLQPFKILLPQVNFEEGILT